MSERVPSRRVRFRWDLVDPAGLEHWLDPLDPETSTVPEYALP
jgi:hypothetical protein